MRPVPAPESRHLASADTIVEPSSSAGLGVAPPLAERERVLAAVVALCESEPAAGAPGPREAIGEIFLRLVADAEHDIRRRLAERIASAPWASRALTAALALDDIDIARPVIARSPVLEDEDLLTVIARATLEHQLAVARRPGLGPDVSRALVDGGDAAAMTALSANPDVRIPHDAMARLVAAARRVAALRAPLARRPELSAELARGLYAWVGEALRRTLLDRFQLDPATLDGPMTGAVSDAFTARSGERSQIVDEQRDSEARLVAKLESSGQLKPGYLLRVLREGRLALFETALAALAGASRPQIRAAMQSASPERLALACAAVGLDRSAFPTLLALVRSLNGDRPGEAPGSAVAVAGAFATTGGPSAAERLRDLSRADGAAA